MADTQEAETPATPEQAEVTEEATTPAAEAPAAPAETPTEGAAPEESQDGTEGDGVGESVQQEGDTQPDGDSAPVTEAPAEGEAKEGEATPAGEGEGEAGEGEKTEEGEEKPQTPGAAAEGEQQAEGEAEKQEGEAAVEEGGEAKTDEGEAEGEGKEAPEGEVKPGEAEGEAGAEGAAEGEQAPAESGEGPSEAGDGEAQAEGEAKEEGAEQTETPREEESKSPLPQSDTFADGERPESTVGVGEKLSREPTPTGDQGEVIQTDMLVPTTPDRQASPEVGEPVQQTLYEEDEEEEGEGDDEEEEEAEEPEFDRDLLIEKYHAALQDREQLQGLNYQLQHKLAEYFRKKKADERQDYDKNVTDQEQRYLKYMAQLEELRRQEQHERENSQLQIEEFKDRCEEKKAKVDEERSKFMDFRKQVALNAINSRSGKPIPPKDIEQYLSNANRKEGEVVTVRLENIKLKNKLKKKEQQLKSKEELAEGLHLIDFEQLKIENQTYNEKIEERNEELLKLRKKITSTVQVLTHLKEKLQFVFAENHVQKGNLKDVEAYVAQRRDILSRTKQARDSLRIDNQRLRQNCGLLGNEPLLRDFEERKDESDDLKDKLESLRMLHAELTLNCNQVRRKIEQARSGRP
ncbi:LOW QUALITY PROTEIN: coiled-coil domain-containing protein 96-like [Haliotis rubra]|uniref:LOW QUALITY PROTEIN: coiled-coil domain-containing protein 96-like n=1 Tax=Haliotis rubra TaxID=36100 RepID=UPI001EE51462|nr:LOW QUALITY PROTEIN: coiled-coil domain-containing protein 96-like [Haliotis rubra]